MRFQLHASKATGPNGTNWPAFRRILLTSEPWRQNLVGYAYVSDSVIIEGYSEGADLWLMINLPEGFQVLT